MSGRRSNSQEVKGEQSFLSGTVVVGKTNRSAPRPSGKGKALEKGLKGGFQGGGGG